MKAYIKYIFIVLSLAGLLVSCNDDDSPAYDFKQAPVISPLAFPSLVLNENETFTYHEPVQKPIHPPYYEYLEMKKNCTN